MKKIKWVILCLIPLGMVALAGCNAKTTGTTEAVSSKAASYNITIELKDGEDSLNEKEIAVSEGQTLLDIMKENYELEEDNGMITAIDGVAQDPSANQFWVFTINDQQVNEGAATVTLSSDDRVVFVLETF